MKRAATLPAPAVGKSRPALERMLRIHQAIQSGRFPNAATLAPELEVSAKTVVRDLEFMRDRLNLPLAYDPRRWGYYYTEDVSTFPSLQITEGELFALLVAEKAVQQYRGTNFEKPLLSALKKMAAALPETVSLHLADWDQTISFRTSAEPILNLEIFDLLAKATARREQLEMVYRKPGEARAETRTVDPYHLANVNGEWYLFAYDHLRRDLRTFVPARIQSVKPTGQTFTRPTGFSVDRQLRGSFGIHSAEGRFEVVVRFAPEVADFIREKRWHASQQLRELRNGGVELRLKLSSLVEIQRWILGWGGRAVVLRPPELVAAVRDAAQAILGARA
ncbi:MAG: WYL domain-containing protein [Verrucomicrobia bacterium]|nr:WYL domain-containing protein [Verrucomicrobiota bacterium]